LAKDGPAALLFTFSFFFPATARLRMLRFGSGLSMKPDHSSPRGGAGRFLTTRSSVVRFSAKMLAAAPLCGGWILS
jgi:hypothetical protein